MPTTQRGRPSSVMQRMLDEPYRFDLVQFLRVLDVWFRRNGMAHGAGMLRFVRFQNSLSMCFPASQIEALAIVASVPVDTAHALQAALAGAQLTRLNMTPAYLGFFGVTGALPNYYADAIASQVHDMKYEGVRAFFDIFTSRIIALHYQAWTKYRIRYLLDTLGDDALMPLQLALAGVTTQRVMHAPPPARTNARAPAPADAADSDDIGDEVIAHYAAVLRHRPISAKAIAAVLAEYFGVPVRLEQFIPAWDEFTDGERTRLGVRHSILGAGMTLGLRSRNRRNRVRIHIGPLRRSDFERFVPGATAYKALVAMIELFDTPSIEFDLSVILRACDITPLKLGASMPRLGRGMFLAMKPQTVDRACYFGLLR